ncbi:MAG TPA: oligosaccharide flippase family protein [Devosiaceae bacterium]|jgi:O-antigen/teichoic acid export membrane protein
MKRLLKLFSAQHGSALRRNFMHVARANILAQIVSLLASPLLTRVYAPADFGAYALFSSISAMIIAGAAWRFDWSVPNARSATIAACLMVLGFSFLAASTILTLMAVAALGRWAPDKLGNLGFLSYLLPIAVLAGGLAYLFQAWFVRSNDLRLVSKTKIAQSGSNVALSVTGGLMHLGASGLIGASVASSWVGILTLIKNAPRFRLSLRLVSRLRLWITLRRFGREASWSTLVAIVNAASFSAIVIALTASFSLHEVGWYTFMYRLAAAPISLISSALGQSFWSAAAQLARDRQFNALQNLYLSTTRRLALLAIPVVLGCLAGPFVVGPIFGEEKWGGAGYVLMALAPMLVGSIVFSSTSHLTVLQRQSMQLFADGVRLMLIVASIWVCKMAGFGFMAAVALASVSSLIGHLILFWLHLRELARFG